MNDEQRQRIDVLWRVVRWWILMLAAAAFVTFAPKAWATKPKPPERQEQHQQQRQDQFQHQKSSAKAQAVSTASSSAVAGSTSAARIGDTSATGGQATAEGGSAQAVSGGVSGEISLTVNEAAPEDKFTIKNTPNVSLGGVYPANPCHKPRQAGVSFPGVGLSGANVTIDENCQKLEWARMAYSLGLRDAALHMVCHMDAARGNPHCISEDEWQDYNMEMGALRDNANIMQGQLDDAHSDIVKLQEENQRLRNEVSTQRLEQAVGK